MSVLYRSSPLFHLLQEALGNLLHKFLEPAKRHGAFIKFFRPFHHIEAVSPFHKPINPPEVLSSSCPYEPPSLSRITFGASRSGSPPFSLILFCKKVVTPVTFSISSFGFLKTS